MTLQDIAIGAKRYSINADKDYGKHLGVRFEPNTTALLQCLSSDDSRILDIGANIGITGILFGQLAARGKVAAIEPVPAAYRLLESNLASAGYQNVSTFNFALGNAEGEVVMQGNPNNLSGAFVVSAHSIDDGFHFRQAVKLHKLDGVFDTLGFDRLDLIKIDVEGYELDVLEGAARTLARYRPIVTLEMNYVALNLWRNMSLPAFRARLLEIFPYVYAVNEGSYVDFRDEKHSHDVQFRHLTSWQFMDLVAGFDKAALTSRLDRLADIRQTNELDYATAHPPVIVPPAPEMAPKEALDDARNRVAQLEIELASTRERISSMEHSHSWTVTAPLRGVRKILNRH
ncbi:FkbM family methyltransferase [Paraburkholderia sp. CNPSo 3274]|uniref:FkbM family methyltransferase n=1 Tax=Paraburkholderia sp. CNPSo 3274 TaxID=2940932 RepID=UPI0020B66637|nr:FkbM family methyltransferase [Paraburkholderia sp. CNPSo 3274]MCP3713253.1 FkbM family methyltransferase [Paraburkholderia sp. CNPSo 3274]